MGRRRCGAAPMMAVVVFFGAHSALGQLQPTHANVAYGPLAAQRLDLYLPVGATSPVPVVVWIHGGGWQSGDKYPPRNAPILLDAGLAVAA